jgi:SDR family mycofactocin-dependent oxidoreductase
MGRVEGKVALITGAARGQGRAHAIKLANEGADIIAIDICKQIGSIQYPLASSDDLDETRKAVEATGRQIKTFVADTRNFAELEEATRAGVSALGSLDIVCANAGIFPLTASAEPDAFAKRAETWRDTIDVNITGTWHTLEATIPILKEQQRGGAIVITSSTAGMKGLTMGDSNLVAYVASKHALTGMVRGYAKDLAPHWIRVNSVHPTGVHTPMIDNDVVGRRVTSQPELAGIVTNALPIDALQPQDVSEAVLYLVSDSGRFTTGSALLVDAGLNLVAPG